MENHHTRNIRIWNQIPFTKLVINNRQSIPESPEVKLTESDFESGQDSTILVRERTRGSKLQGAYQKRKRFLLEQSDHTITFLPAGKSTPTVLSKRDVDHENENEPCCSKEADRQLLASRGEMQTAGEQHTSRQCDSAGSILEMIDNVSTPTPSIQQQEEESTTTNEPISQKKM